MGSIQLILILIQFLFIYCFSASCLVYQIENEYNKLYNIKLTIMQMSFVTTSPTSHSIKAPLSLEDTHETNSFLESIDKSSNCQHHNNSISFYSCCLMPACKLCFSGFHYLECSKRQKQGKDGNYTLLSCQNRQSFKIICDRCEGQIESYGYSCMQCKTGKFCTTCFNKIHKSTKFELHHYQKWSKVEKIKNKEFLLCLNHNKLRSVVTQQLQLICPDCVSQIQKKKTKTINFQQPNILEKAKVEVQLLCNNILLKQQNHKTKWSSLRKQLDRQYEKCSKLLRDRFQQNLGNLQQMQSYDKILLERALNQCRKAEREMQLDCKQPVMQKQVLVARLHILESALEKQRTLLNVNQIFSYKVTNSDSEKFDGSLKNFALVKTRLKEIQQKQNIGLKKGSYSIQRPNTSNLSVSRRSLSKSLSKVEVSKSSALKENNSNNKKSQNFSCHVSTQPIRNSTPPHNPLNFNSSDKKSAILRQSSIMTAKIDDITPVILNFDSKQSNASGNRINFITSKTQQENCLENNISQGSQSRLSKRKSDYFQLRERMKKPSIGNNRIHKR